MYYQEQSNLNQMVDFLLYNQFFLEIYFTQGALHLLISYSKHGLVLLLKTESEQLRNKKDLCKEILNKSISKNEQSSDWGGKLSKEQQQYAATDVLYLHKIKNELDKILDREGRAKLAKSCFDFIEQRTTLDLKGWAEQDIFKH